MHNEAGAGGRRFRTCGSDRAGAIRMGCFWLVFCVLAAWHFYHGMNGENWCRPPLSHGDGPDYESIAHSLYLGEGYQFDWQSESWQAPYRNDPDFASYSQLGRTDWPGPTASRPPFYPVLISCVYRIVPRGPMGFAAVRSVSILCTALAGTLAVSLAFSIASRLFLTHRLAIIAAVAAWVLAMLDRTIRTYSVDFLTEPLAMFLCTCLVASGLQWQEGHRRHYWFACLVLSAVALILTRSMIVFWLPGLAILVAISSERNGWRWASLLLVLIILGLSPWWIRNCVVLERIMPLGGQGAASLCGGYCDEAFADGGNWSGRVEEELQREIDAIPGSSGWTQAQREVALAERATQRTAEWIQTNADQIPVLLAKRIATHWSPFYGPSLLWRIGIFVGWLGLLMRARRELVWILGLPIISTVTVAFLYETGGRFLVPLYSLLYMTAGLGVAFLAKFLFCDLFPLCRRTRS